MLSHIYCLLLWCTENLSFFDQCVSSVRYETTTYSWQLFLARSIFFFLELLLFGNTLYKLFDCTCTKIGTPFLISILLKRKPLNHWIFHEFSMFRTNYYFNSMHFESVKQQQKKKKMYFYGCTVRRLIGEYLVHVINYRQIKWKGHLKK